MSQFPDEDAYTNHHKTLWFIPRFESVFHMATLVIEK